MSRVNVNGRCPNRDLRHLYHAVELSPAEEMK